MNALLNNISKKMVVLLAIISSNTAIHPMSRLNRSAQRVMTGQLCKHMSTAQAADLLQVSPDAPENIVKEQYKKLAKIHHPDAGGNAQSFVNIKEAYEAMLKSRDPLNLDDIDAREEQVRSEGKILYPCSGWTQAEIDELCSFLFWSGCMGTVKGESTTADNFRQEMHEMMYQRIHSRVKARISKERKEAESYKRLLRLDGVSTPTITIKKRRYNEDNLLSSIATKTFGQSQWGDFFKTIENKIWQAKIWYKVQRIYPNITPQTHDYDCHFDGETTWKIAFYEKKKNNQSKQ